MADSERKQQPDPGAKLPRGTNAADPAVVATSQRARLLAAFKMLAARDGYTEVTIAAIVGEAGVSKPTFYERFNDKEDCFNQLLAEVWQGVLDSMVTALKHGSTPFERIEHALAAFLESLAADPDGARILAVESRRAGDRAAKQMSAVHHTVAGLYGQALTEMRANDPELGPISETRSLAIVGAVNEPVVDAILRGDTAQLPGLLGELRAVVYALAVARA